MEQGICGCIPSPLVLSIGISLSFVPPATDADLPLDFSCFVSSLLVLRVFASRASHVCLHDPAKGFACKRQAYSPRLHPLTGTSSFLLLQHLFP